MRQGGIFLSLIQSCLLGRRGRLAWEIPSFLWRSAKDTLGGLVPQEAGPGDLCTVPHLPRLLGGATDSWVLDQPSQHILRTDGGPETMF